MIDRFAVFVTASSRASPLPQGSVCYIEPCGSGLARDGVICRKATFRSERKTPTTRKKSPTFRCNKVYGYAS
ncbi:hypothetical protein FQ185_24910 [Pseudomonas sp. ANT_H12B]|nr:hypothetical protein FQ185_24910 [Pseudomonas sp. ANT_H12B]